MNEEKIETIKPKLMGVGFPVSKRKLRRVVQKCIHMKKHDTYNTLSYQVCTVVGWAGALVVTAVIIRSLYLMYLKPD